MSLVKIQILKKVISIIFFLQCGKHKTSKIVIYQKNK